MLILLIAITAIICANTLWDFLMLFIDWRRKNMSNKYVTLDEFINGRGDFVKQIVYKIEGDFNGDIKGENVTVILMGDGDINGDISSKDGDVVLIKGNINGDVKANKILCPTNKEKPSCRTCKFYISEGVITGQIYCEKNGLLNDAVSCNKWEKEFGYDH